MATIIPFIGKPQEGYYVKVEWSDDFDGEPAVVICEEPHILCAVSINAWDQLDCTYEFYTPDGVKRSVYAGEETATPEDQYGTTQFYPLDNTMSFTTSPDADLGCWFGDYNQIQLYKIE